MRIRGVHLKFNPIVENLRGQRVVVVDDSIVRGTTTPRIVALLREAGAREVHLRITSPPIVHPCYLGVDMATYDELIAANFTVEQIRAQVGADSLGYLSVDGWSNRSGASARDVFGLPDRRISERSRRASATRNARIAGCRQNHSAIPNGSRATVAGCYSPDG